MKRTVSFLIFFAFLIAVLGTPVHSSSNNSSSLEISAANRQYSSPEQTWSLYRDALIKGDYELAKKCCSEGKTKQVSVFERMNEFKRQRLLQDIKSFKKIHMEGDTAKYQMVRKVNGVNINSYVYFSRIDNEWKIEHH